jgi:NADPH-dependent 2,4-dienoyl-CoA reductase/sulfur reductase-like enzyme/nitrite reductase/ring-hydroxylating ferredoxin subunit
LTIRAWAPAIIFVHPMGARGVLDTRREQLPEDDMTAAEHAQLQGPDFSGGVKLSAIADGAMLTGHVDDLAVVLVRRGDDLFAVGAQCPHYGGPLGDGVAVGETIRCPWHHACFSLRSGEVLRAPARDPLPRWRVEVSDGIVYARERIERHPRPTLRSTRLPESVVIIGGGPAGNMAAETLRDEGYAGPITMLSADPALPADRPNLSKDYLAGRISEEWALLRPADFYPENGIDLRLNTRVVRIDARQRAVVLADGSRLGYGALLLATGAEPVRLEVPGATLGHVHYLRTLDDSRALIAEAGKAHRAVIVGASFIGLEAASSLRARGLDVHVVGPEAIPMARVLGPQLGAFIRSIHEQHGVTFHLGRTAVSIDEHAVTLDNGERIDGDLVVVGIGVRPATALAEQAGLAIDRGVLVDQFLETSAPGLFAAGDIARWPDPHSGQAIRVEHFVVAERQGQTAARNMLGRREPFDAVPFFWTEQHDLGIAYVGHSETWDEVVIDGSIEARDCSIFYLREGRKQAVAVIHRDHEGLVAEVEFERALGRPGDACPAPHKLTEVA